MEREAVEFHQKLREGFLDIAENNNRCLVVNAERSVEEIHDQVIRIIDRKLYE